MTAQPPPTAPRARVVAVLLLVTAVAAALLAVAGPEVADGARALRDGTWRTAPLEAALTWCCAAATAGVTAWVWALVVATVVGLLRRPSARPRPGGPVRRLVLVACGVAVVGGVGLAPAHATGSAIAGPETVAARSDVVKAGPARGVPHEVVPVGERSRSPRSLPLPDRAIGGTGGGVHGRTVRVVAGDSLWSVAAEALGPGAPASSIDAYWRAIHAASPDVGPDPDVLQPGDVLRLPPPDPSRRPTHEERTDR